MECFVWSRWRRPGRTALTAGMLSLSVAAVGLMPAVQAHASTAPFEMAFQANNGSLYDWSSAGSGANTGQGMMTDTSPSIAELTNGTEEMAFQANTGNLIIWSANGSGVNTGQAMMAGTSPAITALAGNAWDVAFQARNGTLAIWSSSGTVVNTGQAMMAGTSPAITALASGGWEAAYQSPTDALIAWNSDGTGVNTEQGMMAGTNPAIAGLTGGGWEAAFQADTGSLYDWSSNGTGANLKQGMMAGTSPAITAMTNGGWEAAFEANTNALIAWNSNGTGVNTKQGMMSGTNPAIAGLAGNTWEAAFQADNGSLYNWSSNGSGLNNKQGMMAGTSPAIAPGNAGGDAAVVSEAESQVGYQDSPVGTYCNAYSAYWHAGSECSNGDYSEEWCADFAAWVWRQAGVQFTYGDSSGDINAGAVSFYQWAVANGKWHAAGSGYTPQPGDAVVFGMNSSGTYADHVAIVTSYTPGDAGPNVVNGDWWSSGTNGAVVAASDETSANGTDTISGYASP